MIWNSTAASARSRDMEVNGGPLSALLTQALSNPACREDPLAGSEAVEPVKVNRMGAYGLIEQDKHFGA